MKVWFIYNAPSDFDVSRNRIPSDDEGLVRYALSQTYRWMVGSAARGATKVYFHGNFEQLHILTEDWTNIEAEEYAGLLGMKATAVELDSEEYDDFITSIQRRQVRLPA